MRTIDQTLAQIAGPQAGAFTTRQARDAGVSASALARRRRRGSIFRRHPHTWVLGHDDCSPETARWAAVLAAGPDALICREAAAHDWGISRWKVGLPEIVVPQHRRPLDGVAMYESSTLHLEDSCLLRGRPTTSVERTIVDLAVERSVSQLCRYLLEAQHHKVLDMVRLRRTIARNVHRPGAPRMREALARYLDGDGGADGKAEARFVRMLGTVGEVGAMHNVELRINGALVRPDVWFPDDRVAIELDESSHLIEMVSREDALKEALLASAGILVVRIDQTDLNSGLELVLRTLNEHRTRRQWLPAGAHIAPRSAGHMNRKADRTSGRSAQHATTHNRPYT